MTRPLRYVRTFLLASSLLAGLGGCTTTAPGTVPGHEGAGSADSAAGRRDGMHGARSTARLDPADQRAIEVLLREAELALTEQRLTTPADDNALDRFLHVLVLDPDDARARAGIVEIARRYRAFAERAASAGRDAEARRLLDLAAQVAPDDPGQAAAQRSVDTALAMPRERFELLTSELDAEDPALGKRLQALGRRAKEESLFVVITAPRDNWSRWIYAQMNAAPPQVRLRASAEVGRLPAVELRALAR